MTPHPRLVVLDVDGTLLRHDGTMPEARAQALADLAARVPTVFATGKTWPSIRPLVERFGLTGPHAICNGAALVGADGVIRTLAALSVDAHRDVVGELRRRDVAFATYVADGSIVADAPDTRFRAITDLGEPEPEVRDHAGLDVLKVLAILREDEEADLRSLRDDVARIQRTGPRFLEWNAPTASKGAALDVMIAAAGITRADVVAVGDSENDVPLLLAAGHGVAVADSSQAAVRAADQHLEVDVSEYLAGLAR